MALTPRLGDWNEDLCELGIEALREGVKEQLLLGNIHRLNLPAFGW